MPPAEQAPAFFSYSRTDADAAQRLAADLKSAGCRIWLDQLEIPAGQRWDRAVEEALARAPALLVLLSPAAAQSDNVQDEVAYALDEGKPIVPVLHKPCKVPLRLRRMQYIEMSGDYNGALARIVARLAQVGLRAEASASSSEPATPPGPPATVPRADAQAPSAPPSAPRSPPAVAEAPSPRAEGAPTSRRAVVGGVAIVGAGVLALVMTQRSPGPAPAEPRTTAPTPAPSLATVPAAQPAAAPASQRRGILATIVGASAPGVSALFSPEVLKPPEQGVYIDPSTRLRWTARDNGRRVSWAEAAQYCDGLRLGGIGDWALPSNAQLKSLYDASHLSGEFDGSTRYYTVPGVSLGAYYAVWSERTASGDVGFVRFSDGEGYRVKADKIGAYSFVALCVSASAPR